VMLALMKSKHDEQEESHWLSVADLMAGLMMVFLFIAIALMLRADKIIDIADLVQQNQTAIYEGLLAEFKNDLNKWGAEIDKHTLTFTFKSPDILFGSDEVHLNKRQKTLLRNFFPRYLNVLENYKNSIEEVRIEGHTSSVYGRMSADDAYFKNMALSQSRTRSVLNYVYLLPEVRPNKLWVKKHLSAVGMSSSRLILDVNGNEDNNASRRVDFRIITNVAEKLKMTLEES
jgi:outer membrane protein OmpA-like peptidoglycan-associated protein